MNFYLSFFSICRINCSTRQEEIEKFKNIEKSRKSSYNDTEDNFFELLPVSLIDYKFFFFLCVNIFGINCFY